MLVKGVTGYISGSIVPMFSLSCSNICSCNLPQLVPILHGSCQIAEGSTCYLAHFATVSDVKEARQRQLYIYRSDQQAVISGETDQARFPWVLCVYFNRIYWNLQSQRPNQSTPKEHLKYIFKVRSAWNAVPLMLYCVGSFTSFTRI